LVFKSVGLTVLSLIIVLAVLFILGLARTLLERTDERPIAVVPSCSWSKFKPRAASERKTHQNSSQQNLGKVLAYLCKRYGISLDLGEYFFVKTGFSPYAHECVDYFFAIPCSACEWAEHHRELIEWHREALFKLANHIKDQRSLSQIIIDFAPPSSLNGLWTPKLF
jgi:hypothetical protein